MSTPTSPPPPPPEPRPRTRIVTSTGALRAWWSVAMVLVAAIVIACLNITYTNYDRRAADRDWCELLETLDQPGEPPSTPRGWELQEQIHKLRQKKGCI